MASKIKEKRRASGWAMCWASEQGLLGPSLLLPTSTTCCPSCLSSPLRAQLQAHPCPQALSKSPPLTGGSTDWATWLWFHGAPFLLPVSPCPGFRVGVGDHAQVFASFLTSSTPQPQAPAAPTSSYQALINARPSGSKVLGTWAYRRDRDRPGSGAWGPVRSAEAQDSPRPTEPQSARKQDSWEIHTNIWEAVAL